MKTTLTSMFVLLISFLYLGAQAQTISFSKEIPSAKKRQLEGDFSSLESIRGLSSTKLHQQFFGPGPLDGRTYLKFLMKNIKYVDYAPLAPFILAADGVGTLFVSNKYFELQERIPLDIRYSLLIHEARHSDGKGAVSHELCPDPFIDEQGRDLVATFSKVKLAGQLACDSKHDDAYGVQIIMLKNIQKFCESCALEDRQVAGQVADDLMNRITSESSRQILRQDFQTHHWKIGATNR